MAQSRLSFKEPKKPKTETVSTDIDAILEELRFNVEERFGYGSLYWTIVNDNREKVTEYAKKKGWTMHEGLMVTGFWPSGHISALTFGEKPDKKTMKRMIKEAKGGKTAKN